MMRLTGSSVHFSFDDVIDSNLFYLDYTSDSYEKSDADVVTVTIRRTFLGPATIRLTVTGGKEAGEDWGIGKNFTGAGMWVNSAYETSYTTVSFGAAEQSKEVTLTVVNNPAPELDRTLTLTLSHPSTGVVIGGARTITIVDDNRDALIDVTAPGICPICSANLSGSALVGDGALHSNYTKMQALFDHFRTTHVGASVIFQFPAGTYNFDVIPADPVVWDSANATSKRLYVPLSTNRISLIGPCDGREAGQNRAILTRPNTYRRYKNSNIFSTTVTYLYSADTDDTRLAMKDLCFDGSCPGYGASYPLENSGGQTLDIMNLEQSPIIALGGDYTKNGQAGVCLERCEFKNSPGAGIAMNTNTHIKGYELKSKNNFKGLLTIVGGKTAQTLRNIVSTGTNGFGSIWYELNAATPGNVVGNISNFTSDGDWLQLSLDNADAASVINISNLQHGARPLTAQPTSYSRANTFQANAGAINITDSTIYYENYQFSTYPGVINCTRVNFLSFWRGGTPSYNCCAVPVPTQQYLATGGKLRWTFTDCSANHYGAKPTDKLCYGMGVRYNVLWETYPNEFINLVNFTFGSNLDGGFRVGHEIGNGNIKVTMTNPVFNCPTGAAKGGETAVAVYLKDDADTHAGWMKIINPTWNCSGGKLFYIYGYGASSTKLYKSLLFLNGNVTESLDIIDNAANSTLEKFASSGLATHPFLGADAVEVSALAIASNVCTVTTAANHGFVTNDKVMFDAMREDTNAVGAAALCPNTSVPIFTITRDSDTQFHFSVTAANFTYTKGTGGTIDYTHCYKYPIRTRTYVTPSNNPQANLPSGFAGERITINGTNYRCITSGVTGGSGDTNPNWAAE